jgi:hypothetical protein
VVTEAVAELVDSVRSLGLLRGDAVALDGSKFRAVSSAKLVRGRDAVKHYVEQLDAIDEQEKLLVDPPAVAAALEKLQRYPEPEAGVIFSGEGMWPAYNVQTAAAAEHALIVV